MCAYICGVQIVVLGRLTSFTDKKVNTKHSQQRKDVTIIEVSLGTCDVGTQSKKKQDDNKYFTLPDKMLYNVGLDAAPTDVVCVVPAGMILDLATPTARRPPSLVNELRVLDNGVKGKFEGWGPAIMVFPVYSRVAVRTSGQEDVIRRVLTPFPFRNLSAAESLMDTEAPSDVCAQTAEEQSQILIKELSVTDYTPRSTMVANIFSGKPPQQVPESNSKVKGRRKKVSEDDAAGGEGEAPGLIEVDLVGRDGAKLRTKVGSTLIKFTGRELMNERIRFRASVSESSSLLCDMFTHALLAYRS
jgi:hypothetical protein